MASGALDWQILLIKAYGLGLRFKLYLPTTIQKIWEQLDETEID